MLSHGSGWRVGAHYEQVRGRPARMGVSDRVFGLAGCAVFVAIGLAGYFRTGQIERWLGVAAGALLVLALATPRALSPLNRAWMAIVNLVAGVTVPVVLTIIYLLAIVPSGLLMRLRGHDPLTRRLDRNAKTYWAARPAHRNDMSEQF